MVATKAVFGWDYYRYIDWYEAWMKGVGLNAENEGE